MNTEAEQELENIEHDLRMKQQAPLRNALQDVAERMVYLNECEHFVDLVKDELEGIDEEDLNTSEKNILRYLRALQDRKS